jgi:hypothetical protein
MGGEQATFGDAIHDPIGVPLLDRDHPDDVL